MKIALQLYTIREETKKDFRGALKKVGEIGYDGVEFAGFGDIPAEEMRDLLNELGLEAVASHTAFELLENDLKEVVRYNKIIANSNIVVPYYDFKDRKEYIQFARKLEDIGVNLSRENLKLFYHNHSHEFKEYDGEYGLDILFSNADSKYLKAEIDTCWVYDAGVNPVEYIEKYKGRLPLVHIKDIADGELTEVGNGEINIQAVVDKSKEIGAEWLIVEQDNNQKPGVGSARISYNNLKKML